MGWLTSKNPWPLIARASELVDEVIVPCTVLVYSGDATTVPGSFAVAVLVVR